MNLTRRLISIESSTLGPLRPFAGGPLVLKYADLTSHCTMRCSYPEPRDDAQEIYLFTSVGIALFSHETTEFIVAWGTDTQPWCSIHMSMDILDEITTHWSRYTELGLTPDSTAIDLVTTVGKTQLHVQTLTHLLRHLPCVWTKPVTIGSRNGLVVSGSWKYNHFVGRTARTIELVASPSSSAEPAASGKSWFRKQRAGKKE